MPTRLTAGLTAPDKLDDFELRAIAHDGRGPIAFAHDRFVQFDRDAVQADVQRFEQGRDGLVRRDLSRLSVDEDYRMALLQGKLWAELGLRSL